MRGIKLQYGFTLIELLIVLSITVILSIMSLGTCKSFLQKSRSDTLQTQLLSAIHLARSEAVLLGDKTILCGSNDQQTCSGIFENGYLIKSSTRVIYHFSHAIPEGIIHWRSFPISKPYLEFYSDDTKHSQNGTFWFCRSTAAKPAWAIVLNKSGRTREAFPDKNGNILDDKGNRLIC